MALNCKFALQSLLICIVVVAKQSSKRQTPIYVSLRSCITVIRLGRRLYIHTCIFMCVYIYMHIYIYMYIYTYTYTYNRILFHVAHRLGDETQLMNYHQRLTSSVEDQLSLAGIGLCYVCVSVCVCVCVCVCVSISVSVSVSASASASVSVSVSVSASASVYLYLRLCLRVCDCV